MILSSKKSKHCSVLGHTNIVMSRVYETMENDKKVPGKLPKFLALIIQVQFRFPERNLCLTMPGVSDISPGSSAYNVAPHPLLCSHMLKINNLVCLRALITEVVHN